MKINFTAPINTLGFGYVGLNVLLSLVKLGHEVAFWPIGPIQIDSCYGESHTKVIQQAINNQLSYSKSSPSIRLWHPFALEQHIGTHVHCGFTMFELDSFTEREKVCLENQDVVVVPSSWAKSIVEHNTNLPAYHIFVAPLGVDSTIFNCKFQSNDSPTTTFLNVGKWELRKGHDIIKTAFEKAFNKNDDVKLIMCCNNPCLPTQAEYIKYNEDWIKYYNSSKLSSKIQIIQDRLTSQMDVCSLMRKADCGLFPARAEGWNLDLCEMMALGKEVIATYYSAHTEFCNDNNSRLIMVDGLEPAYDNVWFKGQGQWARVEGRQIDQMIEHMRDVHKLKQEGKLVNRGNLVYDFTWENTAKKIIEAIC